MWLSFAVLKTGKTMCYIGLLRRGAEEANALDFNWTLHKVTIGTLLIRIGFWGFLIIDIV